MRCITKMNITEQSQESIYTKTSFNETQGKFGRS